MNKQEEKSRIAKEDIADSSLELFTEKGFKGTTVRDISRMSGRSMGCIYHHFPNKEEIFSYLIMRQEILPGLERAGQLFFAPDFPENLDMIAQEINKTVAEQRELILLWYIDALEFGGKYARRIIQNAWPAINMALKAAFANVDADRIADGIDPVTAMRVIISAFMSIFMQQEILGVRFTEEDDDMRLISEACKLFLHGLVKG
jgi:AcrR family transcriptional regulator